MTFPFEVLNLQLREAGLVVSSDVTDALGDYALDWLEGGHGYEIAVVDHRIVRPAGGRLSGMASTAM